MTIKLANNARSTLAGSLTNVATSLTVQAGEGVKFPAISGSDYFLSTLVKLIAGVPVYEIVKVTARVTDTFTIVRAQEGTAATTFSAADSVELRMTAGSLDEFVRKTDTNTITGVTTFAADAIMSGASIIEAEGAAVASASTTNIWATDGNTVHVTGTTTIASFGTAPQAGAWMKVIFDGALTLTQSANLNLNNGGSDIVVSADDLAMVYADTTTQMDVFVMRKNGNPVSNIAIPGMKLLATVTPTAVAQIDFATTFTASYDNYRIVIDGVLPAAGTTDIRMQLFNAGVIDTANIYYSAGFTVAGGNYSTANTNAACGPNTLSSGNGGSLIVDICNVNDGTNYKQIFSTGTSQSGVGPAFVISQNVTSYAANRIVSGIRLFWNSGANFAATGKIRVYGVSNT